MPKYSRGLWNNVKEVIWPLAVQTGNDTRHSSNKSEAFIKDQQSASGHKRKRKGKTVLNKNGVAKDLTF